MPIDPGDAHDHTPGHPGVQPGTELAPRALLQPRTTLSSRTGWRRRTLLAAGAAWATAALAPAARAAPQVRPWPAARPVPAFALTDLDGQRWTLGSVAGRPLLLNFWASWCPPCRNEMSTLELLQTRHERAGLVVLAVDFEEPLPVIRRFLERQPNLLPVLPDVDGQTTRAWTERRFPTSVLIDRQGRPRMTVTGELDWMAGEAAGLVEPLLR